ncbi:hypothetical protein IE81DRAFT_368825 [Ceraceosorus guamensis]|uniref:Choline transporter-like protein n=1 Tax=Ceraceosorus guamensis TaxID=1522189 RepID=A0A316VU35_9BASI|nr:hypothetical protein IE81DRAFT_368825 [Ceraceosorus guamensis]PWN39761.1 hypothetical protein IE81DRAFT_368825 [Ceraceosorus guamensis]
MTTFSAYASRFLSNGGGLSTGDPYQLARAGGGHGAEAFMASASSQSSLDASTNSDGLPDEQHKHAYGPLRAAGNVSQVLRGESGASLNLMGASRYGLASAHIQGGARSGKRHVPTGASRGDFLSAHDIAEVDVDQRQDEEEEVEADAAEWRRHHRLLPHLNDRQARVGGYGEEDGDSPSASVSASRIAGFQGFDEADEGDPFLREDAVQNAEAKGGKKTISSTSTKKRRDVPTNQAHHRARGWLAHAESSIAAPLRHAVSSVPDPKGSRRVPASARASGRGLAGDDIYRDLDEASSSTSADEAPRSSAFERRASGPFGSSHRESSADDSSSDALTSSTVSSPQIRSGEARKSELERQGPHGHGVEHSSIREPLLFSEMASSSPSGSLPLPLPGAFRGSTTRQVAADIYAYPHPPAKSGWTPWATGNTAQWREWKDKGALLAWVLVMLFTVVIAGGAAIGAPSEGSSSGSPNRPSPYYTLTRSVPMLFLVALLSVGAAVANLFALRQVARIGGSHFLKSSLVGIPLCLTLGWAWAFAGSFIYDDEKWSGGAWSTVGLRFLSLVPVLAAVCFARGVWKRRFALSRTTAVLELSSRVVASHPALLILSLAQLGVFLLLSVPMISIFARLFLIGHFGRLGKSVAGADKVWHTDASAKWMAWTTLGAWLWTWAALRGVQRVTVAGVVSHWYFHREESEDEREQDQQNDVYSDEGSIPSPAPGDWLTAPGFADPAIPPPPTQVDIVRASFARATGPALGTVLIAALVLSLARLAALIAATARSASRQLAYPRVPALLSPLAHAAAMLAGLSAVLKGVSDFALVYTGITNEPFWSSTRRAGRVARGVSVKGVMDGLIIHLMLDLFTLSLSLLSGLAGFLFSAHNLHVPADAPLVGLLCALVSYWTLRLCADVVGNAADTLFLCFAIDEAGGETHCKAAKEAFEKAADQLDTEGAFQA